MPGITLSHSSVFWRLALLTVAIMLSCSTGLAGSPQSAHRRALDDFQRRLFDYLAVRAEATRELPRIQARPSMIEIYRTRALHVQAVRDAREDANAGDVFGPLASPVIRATIAETLRQRGIAVADLLAEQRADAPRGGHRPMVNDDFPWLRGSAMPYALIVALPPLPRPLQYRVLDRDLILLDIDLGLVVDILPDALPKK